MRALTVLILTSFLILPGAFAGGNRCKVYDELADTKHVSSESLRRMVEDTCGHSGCTLDEAEEIYERATRRTRVEKEKFSGRDAHRRENEQVTSIVRELHLNADQKRRLHDEITGRGLSRDEVMERARDMLDH